MKVVVDASNVAYSTKNENSQPQMSNILAAVKSLEESGDEFLMHHYVMTLMIKKNLKNCWKVKM